MITLWDELSAAVEEIHPEVERLKAEAGHSECAGWGIGGEPYVLRCGCGMPLRALADRKTP